MPGASEDPRAAHLPGERTPILILGGAGSVGRSVATRLSALGHRIVLAGRTASTLERTAAAISDASVRVFDARDHQAISRVAPEVSVVINCSGLERTDVVTSWLEAGCHVVDIAASGTAMVELERIEPRAAALVLGVGLVPGLSTLLASEVHELEPEAPITISTLLGLGEPYGPASAQWTLGQLGQLIADPAGDFENFSEPRSIAFPGGFGRRRARRFDFADRTLLPGRLGVGVTTRLCFDSRIATANLALAARVPGATSALLRSSRLAAKLPLGGDWWALTAGTPSGQGAWAVGRSSVEATALMTALTVHHLVAEGAGRTGVVSSSDILTSHRIEAELARGGVGIGWSQPAACP